MRARKSDDPNLDLLTPTLKELAQQQHLHLPVTGWRLQYEFEEWEDKIKEIWQLHIEAVVPKELTNEFPTINILIYAPVRSPDPDPTVLGRVVGHVSDDLTIYLPIETTTFQTLVSSLQAKLERTHSFVIHITTKNSLAELDTRGYIPVTEVILDFAKKEDDTALPTDTQLRSHRQAELDALMSIRSALWLILVLGVIALIDRAFP